MILGNLLTIIALAGPFFFKNSWNIAPRYYGVLFVMSFVLMLVRGILVRAFPNEKAFARPTEHAKKWPLLAFFYKGGMPSGHEASVTLFCVLLLIAYPNILVLIFGLFAMLTVAVFRYCKEYHTVPQLIAGAASGLVTAVATSNWILL